MYEPHSPTSVSWNVASDPSARPGNILSNPAVQRNFYDADQSIARPARLAFDPKDAQVEIQAKVRLPAKYARHRNRAVWAQALVLFNVVGIPLSQGMYLEYYFNTALPQTNLSILSIILALQTGVLLAMPLLVGRFYRWRGPRSGWKILFCAAAMIAFAVQLALQWVRSYILTLILQGPLMGSALGTLFTWSTLVLSSHYQFNLPLVSMQSGFMGFLGALVYTLVAREALQTQVSGHFAPAASAGLVGGTLFIATLLSRRVDAGNTPPNMRKSRFGMRLSKSMGNIMEEKGTIWSSLPSSIFLYTSPSS
jgi:MFS family permease